MLDAFERRIIYLLENGELITDEYDVLGKPINVAHIRSHRTTNKIDINNNQPLFYPLNITPEYERYYLEAKKIYVGLKEKKYLGGLRLLAQHSVMKSQITGKNGLYSPTALGFAKIKDVNSIYYLVEKGHLEIISCIGKGYDRDDAIHMKIKNSTNSRIITYIPKNAMFEQSKSYERQNLVVSKRIPVIVEAGRVIDIKIPAMCANSDLGSPRGDEMNLTPFRLIKEVINQTDVWGFTL